MKDLEPIQDGDHGPVLQLSLKDQGVVRDLSTMAVEVKIEDENKVLVATVPAVIESPKSAGIVSIYLPGRTTDWEGLGKSLLLTPKYYLATDKSGNPATNLLVNPSFDTDTTPANGLADGWSNNVGGVYTVEAAGQAPPSIFGNTQKVVIVSGVGIDAVDQAVTSACVAGDKYGFGVWYRVSGVSGAKDNNNAYKIVPDTSPVDDALVQFEVGTHDWSFIYGSMVYGSAHSSFTPRIYMTGHSGTWQLDEAFFFKGEWRIKHGETMRLPIARRSRQPKSGGDSLFSVGEFEFDSNNDGVPDGWSKFGSQNTYVMEGRTAYVNSASGSRSSVKVTLNNGTVDFLKFISRGKFSSAETWTMTIKYFIETNLTGSPTSFGISVGSQQFDGSAVESNSSSNFQTTVTGGWLTKSVSLATTFNHNALECFINLNGVTGTMWIDDAKLTRTVP